MSTAIGAHTTGISTADYALTAGKPNRAINGKRIGNRGLTQAYRLRDLAAKMAIEMDTAEDKECDAKAQKTTAIAAAIRAWDCACERARVIAGKPLPGSLRPEKEKSAKRKGTIRPKIADGQTSNVQRGESEGKITPVIQEASTTVEPLPDDATEQRADMRADELRRATVDGLAGKIAEGSAPVIVNADESAKTSSEV